MNLRAIAFYAETMVDKWMDTIPSLQTGARMKQVNLHTDTSIYKQQRGHKDVVYR